MKVPPDAPQTSGITPKHPGASPGKAAAKPQPRKPESSFQSSRPAPVANATQSYATLLKAPDTVGVGTLPVTGVVHGAVWRAFKVGAASLDVEMARARSDCAVLDAPAQRSAGQIDACSAGVLRASQALGDEEKRFHALSGPEQLLDQPQTMLAQGSTDLTTLSQGVSRNMTGLLEDAVERKVAGEPTGLSDDALISSHMAMEATAKAQAVSVTTTETTLNALKAQMQALGVPVPKS